MNKKKHAKENSNIETKDRKKSPKKEQKNQRNILTKSRQFDDPLKGMNEAMVKSMQRLEDPFKGLQVAINAAIHNEALPVMVKSMQRLEDPFKGLQVAMKAAMHNEPLQAMVKSMQRLEDPFKGMRVAMKAAMQITNLNVYQDNIIRITPSNNFEEIFLNVVSNLNSLEKGNDTENFETNITNEYRQVIEDSPKSILSLEFYIMLLITLFLYFNSTNNSIESEERLSRQIDSMGDAIIEKINELNVVEEGKNKNEVYFVVDRAVNLRFSPTTKKNNVKTILYPNQRTRLIDKKGKWRKVEYFNHKTNSLEIGWCYKKYLKRLDK